jgi:hypothetical protein
MVDRRAVFFLLAAVLCALMLPFTPDDYRWVGVVLSIVYLVLAATSYLDFRSRTRRPGGSSPS